MRNNYTTLINEVLDTNNTVLNGFGTNEYYIRVIAYGTRTIFDKIPGSAMCAMVTLL